MNDYLKLLVPNFLTFLLLFPILLFGYKEPIHVKIAHEIQYEVAKELSNNHNMKIIGKGGGMIDNVNIMSLSFQIEKSLELNDARHLIVHCANHFLSTVNESLKIRKYLKNYPFEIDNIEINIFSISPNGENYYHPFIEVVSIEDGKFVFRTTDKSNTYAYKSTVVETYEEALQKVQCNE